MYKGRALVTGAAGFIGGHLVARLKKDGYWVRGVDIVHPHYHSSGGYEANEFRILDLRDKRNCSIATSNVDYVYNLAADMGGIGYIGTVHASITLNNILINTHMLDAAYQAGVKKYFFSSSACVYPAGLQRHTCSSGLLESDAIPAEPEEGYGWEKLFTEQLCKYYFEDYAFQTRVARFHNVYGPYGTYEGGKEKAPAAICRKVVQAEDGQAIEVWGDGHQTRSFLYIDDCIEGILAVTNSPYYEPFNVGSELLITVDELVDIVARIAGKTVIKEHNMSKPQGVRGRTSDNTKIVSILGWKPQVSLEEGLRKTYEWIHSEVCANAK